VHRLIHAFVMGEPVLEQTGIGERAMDCRLEKMFFNASRGSVESSVSIRSPMQVLERTNRTVYTTTWSAHVAAHPLKKFVLGSWLFADMIGGLLD